MELGVFVNAKKPYFGISLDADCRRADPLYFGVNTWGLYCGNVHKLSNSGIL